MKFARRLFAVAGIYGVALAWQLMFLVIAKDPIRYRLAILPVLFAVAFGITGKQAAARPA